MTVPKGNSNRRKPRLNERSFDPSFATDETLDVSKWPSSHVRMRNVDELVPYARNARTHSPDQVIQIARLIQKFGWTTPVLIRAETGVVIAGHGRLLAAERLGLREVPAMEAVGWTDAQVCAYVIADNKVALNAGWDEQLLAAELRDLVELGFDIDLTGFSDEELDKLDAAKSRYLTDPDDVPEVRSTPVSRTGDVWQLGSHRLICADSTSATDIVRLMDDELADACWTDPPYNVAYQGRAGSIANDDMEADAFREFLTKAFSVAAISLKLGAACYVAHADTEGLAFRAAFQAAGFKLSGCLIWRKNALVLGRSDYQWQHEPVLYGWKPGAAHRWYGGRKATTIAELDGSVFSQNADGTVLVRVDQQSLLISGTDLTVQTVEPTVLWVARPSRSDEHPTMKPVELIARMLRNSTQSRDIVLDLFGGSGSTLICCEMLGRSARLCELDPRFVDVIVRRWQDFTGQAALLTANARTFADVERARQPEGAA
jgi:DNA modification methylase